MDLGDYTISSDSFSKIKMKHYIVGIGMVRADGGSNSTTISIVATTAKQACDLAISVASAQCKAAGWRAFFVSSIAEQAGIQVVE